MTDMRGRLTTVKDVMAFALAGNARLTLVSDRTGARQTFKVSQCKNRETGAREPLWFVSVLTGADNESDYTYLGTIRDGTGGHRYSHGRKSPIAETATSATVFAWFWRDLASRSAQGELFLHAALQVWHEGRCGRCGRALTVPSSIAQGFGPECIGKMEAF